MKKKLFFVVIALVAFLLQGCTGTAIINEGERKAAVINNQPIKGTIESLAKEASVTVTASSANAEDSKEAEMLASELVANLTTAGYKTGVDQKVKLTIIKMEKISSSKRFWLGALAGQSEIYVQCEVTKADKTSVFEIVTAESGGLVSGGTTEDVVKKAAARLTDVLQGKQPTM